MTWPAVNHYYEAVADRADADRYYAGVGLDEVAELVTRTHRERPRYRPAVELYPWVDLQPDRSLRSLYTGHRYDPAELIAADVRTAEQRHAERARIAVVRSHVDDAAVQDMVERMLPQLVVPQSWFGKKEPMRGGLHYLFACESRCNSFHGNTPYTEFADFPAWERVVRTECAKSEQNGFEPVQGKGAAARAVFYFLLRYPTEINPTELPRDRWHILLDWHAMTR